MRPPLGLNVATFGSRFPPPILFRVGDFPLGEYTLLSMSCPFISAVSPICTIVLCLRSILFHHTAPLYRAVRQCDLPSLLVINGLAIPSSSSMSARTMPSSLILDGSNGMFVMYILTLFCPLFNALLTMCTLKVLPTTSRMALTMMLSFSLDILTFSSKKYLGLIALSASTNL